MADKKLNELGTIESFDNAYVELSQNQYRISKTNLGKQLTNEVHTNFSVASANPAYIYAQKSDGTNFRISRSDLAKSLNDNRALYDGCFIMFHRQSDGWPLAVPYAAWTSYQDSGEEADGVLIVEGGHSLVIAPHEKSCNWSSKIGSVSRNVSYSSRTRISLLNDWDGKDRTEKICGDPSSPFYEESNNDSTNDTYAPGYCYNYTPHGPGTNGLKTGQYWLPCVAELMMIYTHKYRIDAGLSLINGANRLSDFRYWSSTEENDEYAWFLSFNDGQLSYRGDKIREGAKARPVSAFIHNAY